MGLSSWLSSKESICNAGATGDSGWIPRLGRSPQDGNGNPLQYSCLENPIDRGAWQAIVHGVAKSQAWLSNYHSHSKEGRTSADSLVTSICTRDKKCFRGKEYFGILLQRWINLKVNYMTYVSHKKKSLSVAFLKVILKGLFILMDRDCLWII